MTPVLVMVNGTLLAKCQVKRKTRIKIEKKHNKVVLPKLMEVGFSLGSL